MIKSIRAFAFAAVLALAACGTPGAPSPVPVPQTPAQAAYALSVTYDAALSVSVAYAELPECVIEGPPVCHDRDIVLRSNVIAKKAWAAIKTVNTIARAIKPDQTALDNAIAAAKAAVGELSSITAIMKVS